MSLGVLWEDLGGLSALPEQRHFLNHWAWFVCPVFCGVSLKCEQSWVWEKLLDRHRNIGRAGHVSEGSDEILLWNFVSWLSVLPLRLSCSRGGASGQVNQFPKPIKAGGRAWDLGLFVSSLAELGAAAVLHTLYYI